MDMKRLIYLLFYSIAGKHLEPFLSKLKPYSLASPIQGKSQSKGNITSINPTRKLLETNSSIVTCETIDLR